VFHGDEPDILLAAGLHSAFRGIAMAAPLDEREPTTRRQVTDSIRHAAHAAHEMKLAQSVAHDAIEQAVHEVKVGIRGRVRQAEDLRDEMTTWIRREPFLAIGAAFGAGLGVAGAAM
jgi:hypothetical protein